MKSLHATLFVMVSVAVLAVSSLGLGHASRWDLSLPFSFETPYLAARTIVSLCFVGFFLVLMLRHALLFLFAVLDPFSEAVAERRSKQKTGPRFEPSISIVVPVFNDGEHIEATIRSLLALDYPRYEVLIVDYGSTDDTLARARAFAAGMDSTPSVRVLGEGNSGRSAAVNFGIETATGEFFLCLDPSTVLSKRALQRAIRHLEDAEVAAVAGPRGVASINTLWSRFQYLEGVTGLHLVRRAQGFARRVGIDPSLVGLFRKSAVEGVGLYSEDMLAAECDVSLKLQMAGWKVCYEPRTLARAQAPERLFPLLEQRCLWTRGILQAIRKHRRGLFGMEGAFGGALMLWFMLFEAIVWPLMTKATLLFLIAALFDTALRPAAVYFWSMLIMLDTATTLFGIAIHQKNVLYALLAPVERVMFTMLVDLCRLFALFTSSRGGAGRSTERAHANLGASLVGVIVAISVLILCGSLFA